MRIVLTGGGSGGHIIPILATIKHLLEHASSAELLYIGSGNAVERAILENHQIPSTSIRSGKWRRYASVKNISDMLFNIPVGILQSFWHLWKFMPDVVVSKGGYVAIPVIIAARALRISVIIHESDIVPGAANAFSAKFASVVAVSFEETAKRFPAKKKQNIFITGNPIREEVLADTSKRAKATFGIADDAPVILVLGGSQGAKRLNDAIVEMLPTLTKHMHVIHACGELHYKEVKQKVELFGKGIQEGRYHPYDFMDEQMADAYSAANVVVTRAGAGSLNEIMSRGLPSIIVPLEGSANDHQRANAYYYEQRGASLVIEEPNLTQNILIDQLRSILEQPETYEKMSKAAYSLAQPNAANNFADVIIQTIEE